jgi:hypothetical protein
MRSSQINRQIGGFEMTKPPLFILWHKYANNHNGRRRQWEAAMLRIYSPSNKVIGHLLKKARFRYGIFMLSCMLYTV